MGKSGKTFTLDYKILMWLEEYAKKEKMSESAMVNSILNSVKKRSETWLCSECGGINLNDSTVCYADVDCEGVKA
jgi:rubrerythrin